MDVAILLRFKSQNFKRSVLFSTLTFVCPTGNDLLEESPYEPMTSRASDVFRLAPIYSGRTGWLYSLSGIEADSAYVTRKRVSGILASCFLLSNFLFCDCMLWNAAWGDIVWTGVYFTGTSLLTMWNAGAWVCVRVWFLMLLFKTGLWVALVLSISPPDEQRSRWWRHKGSRNRVKSNVSKLLVSSRLNVVL